MENNEEKQLIQVWKTKGKGLVKPSVYYAIDKEDNTYFIFRGDSTILFMIPTNCDITYALPKKYCVLRKSKSKTEYYEIENLDKMIVVSCIGTKSPYEKFVIENLIQVQSTML